MLQANSNSARRFAWLAMPSTWGFILGFVLLAVWCTWWCNNILKHKLVNAQYTWVPAWSYLGLDFMNNYTAARHWMAGGDPYIERFGDPNDRRLCYPPLVLPSFAWCAYVTPRKAVVTWLGVLVLCTCIAGVQAWRSRRELNLTYMPLTVCLAGLLFCAPMLYAFERGNYDLAILPFILIAAWGLREKSWARDILVGCILAFATAIKIYPVLLVAGLIPLRRFRALAVCGITGICLLGFRSYDLPHFRENVRDLVAKDMPSNSGCLTNTSPSHTITGSWTIITTQAKFKQLAKLPPLVACGAVLLPWIALVSIPVWRSSKPQAIILPYFLWLTAAASFVPPIANDYSLGFLPLAMIATWDRRDSVVVHLAMGLALLWLQPMRLEISGTVLLVLKYLALAGLSLSLARRVWEQNRSNLHVEEPQADQPTLVGMAA